MLVSDIDQTQKNKTGVETNLAVEPANFDLRPDHATL